MPETETKTWGPFDGYREVLTPNGVFGIPTGKSLSFDERGKPMWEGEVTQGGFAKEGLTGYHPEEAVRQGQRAEYRGDGYVTNVHRDPEDESIGETPEYVAVVKQNEASAKRLPPDTGRNEYSPSAEEMGEDEDESEGGIEKPSPEGVEAEDLTGAVAAEDDSGADDSSGDSGDVDLSGNVAEITARVGDDAAEAKRVREAEEASDNPRASLIDNMKRVEGNA